MSCGCDKPRFTSWVSVIIFLLIGVTAVWAHQGHQHPSGGNQKKEPIEPIFKAKCLQCHGGTPDFPWYYQVPGIRGLIDKDIEESRHHLDFSKGYPFISHASPLEDLQAIQKSIEESSMPPFIYLLGHRNHRLSEHEKDEMVSWTKQGISELSSIPSKPSGEKK